MEFSTCELDQDSTEIFHGRSDDNVAGKERNRMLPLLREKEDIFSWRAAIWINISAGHIPDSYERA
jgi:hypothetical protein